MGFVAEGGYTITTVDGTLRHRAFIDEKTLMQIAELLGIPKAEAKQLTDIRSIAIFRNGRTPLKGKAKRSSKRG
jgi:hypothetical protein